VRENCGTVTVVDDDGGFRTFLISVLERAGYTVAGVATAEEALAAFGDERPDLVVTDVQLPGMSGYELCRQLKESYGSELSLLIVSGERTEPFDRAAGILLGADDYMVKPVDPEEVLARVMRLIGRTTSGATDRRGTASKLDALTARERQVLDLLSDGADQDEVAGALFISPNTVATHIQHILVKLGVRSRTQAVALALRAERDSYRSGGRPAAAHAASAPVDR